MTNIIRTFVTAAIIGLFAFTAPLSAQEVKEEVKGTYGDWEVVCISRDGKEQCVMRQFGSTADGKKVLEVQVQKLEGVKTQDGKVVPAAIQITTPLGTLLRRGVSVKIDKGEPRTGVFEVCLRSGCVLRDPMAEEFLGQLKAGKHAKMTFAMLGRGELSVEISLKGFTKAYKSL